MVRLQEIKGEEWKAMADHYDKLTIETAVRPIGKMLEQADAMWPFSKATGVLDNGCGPGAVMARILKDYEIPESCSLTCSDFSEAMVQKVGEVKDAAVKENEHSPWKKVQPIVQNAMDLDSIQDSSVSHVTAGWVYFMTPDPQKCLSESKRVLKDGGVLTCSSWEGSQWIDLMNLLPRIRPDKQVPDMPQEWRSAGAVKAELEKAGFQDVESYRVDTVMRFETLEPLVDFFLTKLPHLVRLTKDFSEDELAKLKALWMEEGKKMCPSEPGEFTGTALVAVGRK